MDGHLACLSKSLIVEASLADFKGVPFLSHHFFVDVDDVEIFILCNLTICCILNSTLRTYHPKFMSVIAHQHSPMLGWVWVFIDAFSNLLTKSRLLSEPLAT